MHRLMLFTVFLFDECPWLFLRLAVIKPVTGRCLEMKHHCWLQSLFFCCYILFVCSMPSSTRTTNYCGCFQMQKFYLSSVV